MAEGSAPWVRRARGRRHGLGAPRPRAASPRWAAATMCRNWPCSRKLQLDHNDAGLYRNYLTRL